MAERPAPFDPIRMLQTLDRYRVNYIVIGAFARVVHGADEVTDGLDITPSPRPENLRRLELALQELGVATAPKLDQPTAIQSDAGEMKIVLEPHGTGGYDDIRRGSTREPLGAGVRPAVASTGDLARMLAASGTDPTRLQGLRRVAEIDASLGRGL